MFGYGKLVAALVAEKAVNAELRAQLAKADAHFNWLSQHVNELKLERAALLDRCVGIQLAAVPMIQRELVALPGEDVGYVPPGGRLPNIGDILAQAREIVEDGKRPKAEQAQSLAAADIGSVSFEDMGDDAAKRMGITHDVLGNVVHVE